MIIVRGVQRGCSDRQGDPRPAEADGGKLPVRRGRGKAFGPSWQRGKLLIRQRQRERSLTFSNGDRGAASVRMNDLITPKAHLIRMIHLQLQLHR